MEYLLRYYNQNSKIVIHNSTFTNNNGSQYGAIIKNNVSPLEIYSSRFANNYSQNGGNIYNNQSGSSIDIVGSTFINNDGYYE